MNKQDLIAKVAMDAGLSKASAAAAVESFLEGVAKALKKGGSVIICGAITRAPVS
jgi:DNA-binding protein HU-beta